MLLVMVMAMVTMSTMQGNTPQTCIYRLLQDQSTQNITSILVISNQKNLRANWPFFWLMSCHLTLGEASMISRQLGTTPKLTIRNVLHPQQSRPCSPLAEKRTCLSLWCLGYSQRLITDFWNACSSSKPRGITSAAGMICHHTQQDLPDSDWQE